MRNSKRVDVVFRDFAFKALGRKNGSPKAAKAIAPIRDEVTLDVLWGLKPTYTGLVLRRKAVVS